MKEIRLLITCVLLFVGISKGLAGQEKPAILVLGSAYSDPMGTGGSCLIDPVLEEKLKKNGYRVASTYYSDLTEDVIRKFNIVILLQEAIYDQANTTSYDVFIEKLPIINRFLKDGGGVMVFFDERHYSLDCNYSINKFLEPLDIKVSAEPFNDSNKENYHVFELIPEFGAFRTTDILEHPATKGVKEWWYPIITRAIHPGKNWQVIINAPQTAHTSQTYKQSPPLVAVSESGKGRIALFTGHSSFYVLNGYHRTYEYGWMFNSGDGNRLFENLYMWLSEPSIKDSSFGGYAGEKMPEPKVVSGSKIEEYHLLKNAKAMPGIMGVYTTYSGGMYTVQDFAKEARQLGLKYIAITDKITTKDDWEKLKTDCEQASDEDFVVLPGVEFNTSWREGKEGLKGFAVNIDKWPPTYGNDFISVELRTGEKHGPIVIVANPQKNALPPWNHGGFHALEIASFNGNEQFTGAIDWYRWLQAISPSPGWYPVVSHRIWNLQQLEETAKSGFKNYLYAETVPAIRHAPIEGLTPGFVSNGPVIERFRTETLMRDLWECYYLWQTDDICKIDIKISGPSKITEVILKSGWDIIRHFRPNATSFKELVKVPMHQDGSFYLEVMDEQGRVAYSYTIPTRNLNYWNHIGTDAMNDYHNPVMPDKDGDIIYKGERYGYGGLVTLGYGWGNYIRFYHPVPVSAFHPRGYETGQIPAGLADTRTYPKIWASKPEKVLDVFEYPKIPSAETSELDLALTQRESRLSSRDVALVHEKVDYVSDSGMARPTKYINSDTDITLYRYDYRPFGYIIMQVDTSFAVKTLEFEALSLQKRHGLEIGLLALTYKTNKYFKEITYIDPNNKVITEPIDLTKAGTVKVFKIGKGGYFTMSPDPFGQVGLFALDGNYDIEIQGGPTPVVWIGYDLDGESILNGRKFEGHFIVMEEGGGQGPQICEKLHDIWGLDGKCSYVPEVITGSLKKALYTVDMTAQDYAIVAQFKEIAELPNGILPLKIEGVNSNWTVASINNDKYYPAASSGNAMYAAIETPLSGRYFMGNPVIADNNEVRIEILKYGHDEVVATVHNPTKSMITSEISASKFVPKPFNLHRLITLKPGDTIEISGKFYSE